MARAVENGTPLFCICLSLCFYLCIYCWMCRQGLLIVLKLPQAVPCEINNTACLWQMWCISTASSYWVFLFFVSFFYLAFWDFQLSNVNVYTVCFFYGVFPPRTVFKLLSWDGEWLKKETGILQGDGLIPFVSIHWQEMFSVSRARLSISNHLRMAVCPFKFYIAFCHHLKVNNGKPQRGFKMHSNTISASLSCLMNVLLFWYTTCCQSDTTYMLSHMVDVCFSITTVKHFLSFQESLEISWIDDMYLQRGHFLMKKNGTGLWWQAKDYGDLECWMKIIIDSRWTA